MRHFICLSDFSRSEIEEMLALAKELKAGRGKAEDPFLSGKTIALLFEKPSTRTRVSFEVAIGEAGGRAIFLSQAEVGLGRREAVKDVARTLSRYVHGVVIRTFAQETLEEFCRFSSVPVINALTDKMHPCQALADVLTISERVESFSDVEVAYIGDANNVLYSLISAAALLGFRLVYCTPAGFGFDGDVVAKFESISKANHGRVVFRAVDKPLDAVREADFVYTDVWVSMGQETIRDEKLERFAGFQINDELLKGAKKTPYIMHCLPAHRGEEIADDVLDGPRSIVFDQAENRLHAQKAVLRYILK